MASILKTYNSMGLPMNINRSNPIPVDSTELWYSLEEAKNYALNDPRAYVGQSIKVINESTNSVACYVVGVDGLLMEQSGANANLQLYDTVVGAESINVNAAAMQCELNVTLSSETYTDFSNITVVLTSENGEQSIVSGIDGVVTGLISESIFTLSLQSDATDFDPSLVVISCTYQLDLNRVLHDYVLHVDMDGEAGSDDVDERIFIDETLSITGAAADAKATGEAISNLNNTKVPTTRTINGKDLSTDIIITAEDVGYNNGRLSDFLPVIVSQDEYDALVASGSVNETTLYLIRQEQ